jgi:hypothetical protein
MTFAKIRLIVWNILLLISLLMAQSRSEYDVTDPVERVRAYTRWIEFDYVSWTIDALKLKGEQGSLDIERYLSETQQRETVLEYIALVMHLNQVRNDVAVIYANPEITDKSREAAALLAEQEQLQADLRRQGPLAESVLQHQVSVVLAEIGLSLGGQPFPPLLYHVTPLPNALIVSPRKVIQQDADVSLLPDLTLDQIDQLEQQVEQGLDVSALVVPVGGIGIYPTMVMSSSDLEWLVEVISHEWIHNFLTLRPLGALYYSSPELRTINETTAEIAGKEIGNAVLKRFYPDFLPPPPPPLPQEELFPPAVNENGINLLFNYRAEMHETRVQADALLAEGKIQEAESYMESRRQFFWDHGYRIRRLNQAYFAFYGAYADVPGGAAGADPVGSAVRILRAESLSLAKFVNRISWVTSFEALQRMTRPNVEQN